MPVPVVYLDECVNQSIITFLQGRGVHIETAQAHGMSNALDDVQIRYATDHSWPILSTNAKHFVRWHTIFRDKGWSHAGIITLPQSDNRSVLCLRCGMLLDWIGTEFPDIQNMLVRWTDLQQHLINGYALEGYIEDERAIALGRTR